MDFLQLKQILRCSTVVESLAGGLEVDVRVD